MTCEEYVKLLAKPSQILHALSTGSSIQFCTMRESCSGWFQMKQGGALGKLSDELVKPKDIGEE
jgi:hypothetical protein